AQFPQLAVLARHERLLHHGDLEIEILLREVEVRRECFDDASFLVRLEDERAGLVVPRHSVVVKELRALEFGAIREPRLLTPTECLEIRRFQGHPKPVYGPRRTL